MTNENNEHDEEGCGHTDAEHEEMYGTQLGGLLSMARKLKDLVEMVSDDGDPEVQKLTANMDAHKADAEKLVDMAMKDPKNGRNDRVFFDPTLMSATQILMQKLVGAGVFDMLDMVNLAKFAAIMVGMTSIVADRIHGETDTLETMLAGIEIDL